MSDPHQNERSFFSSGSRIEGTLEIQGEVQLQGKISGKVIGSGTVRIGEQATVDADIHAPIVAVAGTVRGEIHAPEKLELLRSAKVTGLVKTSRLRIDEGAFLEGECKMTSEAAKTEPAKLEERRTVAATGQKAPL
jgi:cytoskeletal protein CcmA (bactofilin family)